MSLAFDIILSDQKTAESRRIQSFCWYSDIPRMAISWS